MLGPISLIIYLEFGFKGFYYGYIFWKIVSSTFKTFWDFYYDWGLLRGTKPHNRLLRDKIEYAPWFYYLCMVLNVIGLFFWAFVLYLYD